MGIKRKCIKFQKWICFQLRSQPRNKNAVLVLYFFIIIQVTNNFLYLLKPCKVLKSFHSIRLEQCEKMYGTKWSTYSDREFQLKCRHGGWCKKFLTGHNPLVLSLLFFFRFNTLMSVNKLFIFVVF